MTDYYTNAFEIITMNSKDHICSGSKDRCVIKVNDRVLKVVALGHHAYFCSKHMKTILGKASKALMEARHLGIIS